MRCLTLDRLLAVACLACLFISFTGCESKTETTGPEMGSIESYLDEHPEARVDDDDDDAGNEGEEFGASDE